MNNLIVPLLLLGISLLGAQEIKKQYRADIVPQHMSSKEKKRRFYTLVVPPIQKAYKDLYRQYLSVKKLIDANPHNATLDFLKRRYHAHTNEDLLKAIKPHPPSIAIAQAAMESAWGTSRFFREANNIFGIWNKNKNAKRIAASVKREGNVTIWLSKYDSLEASVRAYYHILAKRKEYKSFREVRYYCNDLDAIVAHLYNYSERGFAYTEELTKLIHHNKLERYDIIRP